MVYLVGGANREATSFGDVYAFDLGRFGPVACTVHSTPSHSTCIRETATKKWELLAPSSGNLPARSGHSTVAVGSELVVFGGFNAHDGVVYNDIHVFDTGENRSVFPDKHPQGLLTTCL